MEGRLLWSVKIDHVISNFLKKCLPQILQGPFLNTLSHMTLRDNFQGNVGDILVSMT